MSMPQLSDFELGLVLGLFIGEVHFGGDKRQPHVVLKMHQKHESLFLWLKERLPEGKLYGPYRNVYKSDGKERVWYQLMFRGPALRDHLIPLLDSYDWEPIAPEIYARYKQMKTKYKL